MVWRLFKRRKQYVTDNGITSDMEVIKCGVPEGSILGPLLFLFYINDLATVSNAHFTILFPDDTNIFITGKGIEEMCTDMNDELDKIQSWLNCNKLSLNVLKTHYIILTPRNVCINGSDIRIDHSNYICKKIS